MAAEVRYTFRDFNFTSTSENSFNMRAELEDLTGVTQDSWNYATLGLIFNETGAMQYRVPFSSHSQVFTLTFCSAFTCMHIIMCKFTHVEMFNFLVKVCVYNC